MGTAVLSQKVLVPVQAYLNHVYRPDREYVDGVVERRNMGEYDHADIQQVVLLALLKQGRPLGYRAMQELRVQVSETRFRIPDVCLLPVGLRTPIIRQAPLLCVEVLSPRDRIVAMRERCEDFLLMGVPAVWIFDPQRRTAYVLTAELFTEQRNGTLQLSEPSITLDVEEIFAALDVRD